MSLENGDFRRDVGAEACLGACRRCPKIVPEVNELQGQVDYNMQRLRASLSDKVEEAIKNNYINFNKDWDDPEGLNVPELPPEVLERRVLEYRQKTAANTYQFDDYVSNEIASIQDIRRGCNGPLEGELRLGAQTVRVAICNRPDAPGGTSLELAWVRRD